MEITKIIGKLFNKDGSLSPPIQFQKYEYNWKISLELSERHNVPSIDLRLQCDGMKDDESLSVIIRFGNLTKGTSFTFHHVFDRQRNSFCYRRIVTGVRHVRKKDGKTIASFPINRFLIDKETGEHYDSPKETRWPFHNPLTWNVLDDGRVETNPRKKCYDRFNYMIVLHPNLVIPNGYPQKWPKSDEYPMQIEYFEPVWKEVRFVLGRMYNGKSSDDCSKLVDIAGAYYHQWNFDEDNLMELNTIAIQCGFLEFMDGIGIGGDYFKMLSSKNTANVVKKSRSKKLDFGNEKISRRYEKVWNVLWKSFENSTIFKIFLKGNLQWNVNFYLSKFRNNHYVSIGAVLVGDLRIESFYECTWEVLLISKNRKVLITRRVRRLLNRTQNSICIPVFCLREELIECDTNEVEFKVNLTIQEVDEEHSKNFQIKVEMPGQNNVLLKLEDKYIAVNKEFLADHVQFFSGLFFNESFGEHNKKEIEITSVSYEEMIQFLDVLYHGTKVFDVSQYYHILRMADEWICRKVISIVEKAVKNSECKCINKMKLEKKFNLKYVKEAQLCAEILKRESIDLMTPLETKKPRVE